MNDNKITLEVGDFGALMFLFGISVGMNFILACWLAASL